MAGQRPERRARPPDVAALVTLLQLATKDRMQLALENVALRHQLAVYKRSVGSRTSAVTFN